MRELAANLVSLLHAAVALYVLVGLIILLLGELLEWCWTRNRAFRLTHLALIAFITLRAGADVRCPLSVLEDHLHAAPPHGVLAAISFRAVNPNVFLIGSCAIFFSTITVNLPRGGTVKKSRGSQSSENN